MQEDIGTPQPSLNSNTFASRILLLGWSVMAISTCYLGYHKDIFVDDSYYYLLPAINKIKLGYYTFDGINPTNGFHPLYMWFLTALLYPFGGLIDDPFFSYFTTVIATTLMLIGVPTYLYSRKSPMTIPILLSIIFCHMASQGIAFQGMETTMVAVLFPLLVFLKDKGHNREFSVVLALLCLSRLDLTIFFCAPLAISLYFEKNKHLLNKERFLFVVRIFLPAVVAIGLYMLSNVYNFGNPKPISGNLKSSFPHVHVQLQLLQSVNLYAILMLSILSIGYLTLFRKNEKNTSFLIALSCAAILMVMNFVLFQKWAKSITTWYFFTPLLLSSFVFSVCGVHLSQRLKIDKMVIPLFALVSLFFSYKIIGVANTASFFDARREPVIQFLADQPKEKIFAYTDNGKFSYWSGKQIINLDGLINNFEYQEYLRDKNLSAYFKLKNVDYVMGGYFKIDLQHSPYHDEPMYRYRYNKEVFEKDYNSASLYLYSHLYNTHSEKVELHQCAEVWSSPIAVEQGIEEVFKIFEITNTCNTNLKQQK